MPARQTLASIACRVCNRPLRNPISIAQGVGPVCIKKVRAALNSMLESVQRGEAAPNYQLAYAASPEELANMVREDVANAYREQRRNRRPSSQPVQVEMESVTRGRNEEVTVEWIDANRARVYSASGNTYHSTHDACDCPDFRYRLARDPELAAVGCRHMQALRLAQQRVSAARTEQRRLRTRQGTIPDSPIQIHEDNLSTFAQIDWTEDSARERVLDIWRRERAFDGIYMSRNDEAWSDLQESARNEWEYQYSNVLGGTNNTFGIEIEVKFRDGYSKQRALRALYDAGLTNTASELSYHSQDAPGFWKPERDGSLGSNGLELVSPVLNDNSEAWQKIQEATRILSENGAYVDNNCGGHVHIGIAPLDHRTYSWQRLARIGVGYERQFFRMGGANSDTYRRNGTTGIFRGTSYANPLPVRPMISSLSNAQRARSILSPSRYTIFNATNVDGHRSKPTVEMRYPNATLDHRQLQAQIQVANAVIHQASIIRNNHPCSEFTPKFTETEQHLRYSNIPVPGREENNFRSFLDVLGNKKDRLAATWLWLRGRAR
ncbi:MULTISPECIES: amidoligase family protein [unclassified Paenibacillus]|uniref:amidoligase family protein n=1 Tax=unclassified Paenibacillus TaxID=185978 RepID=UPI00020D7894|nr:MULTISPECIES: amidoligase family protein [unclassified Paenibacillus]EGL18640.1 hypothetical protein HMPREF9413_3343 [Paenibacillus sp. HGF7]EPD80504.1 hypothetical protein HMPREF1207_05610 [Paenibacillus sp. HGH0039]